jgi:hypothetical protein
VTAPGEEKTDDRPRVLGVSLSPQLADRLRTICSRRGWEWLDLANVTARDDVTTKKADLLVTIGTREKVALGAFHGLLDDWVSSAPMLVFDTESGRSAPDRPKFGERHLAESANDDTVSLVLDEMLRDRGTLEFALKAIDADSRRLAHNEHAEWVRSRLGIIGMVVIPQTTSGPELKEQVALAVRSSYSLLDALPEDQLSLEDLWNLLLFVAVPWTQADADSGASERREVLDDIVRDMSGSRKLILWKDRSIADHLGPMGRRGTLWLPASPDPLRDTLQTAVRDPVEMDALESIFKARISEADLERIIRVLSRQEE